MAIDLNALAAKMKQQRNVGVTRDGRLQEKDPHNDGTRNAGGFTTLEPKRFA